MVIYTMVFEFRDNRLKGLLAEIEDAIAQCDDPLTLWRLGKQLKLFSDDARGKGFDLQPKSGNRFY